MGGKIDCYVDSVSPYSYFAVKYLLEQRFILESYGVEVEFHPFFLGGVNVATGNKPPWLLPAKAKYGAFDRKRANQHFGVDNWEAPPFFPILSIFPQRCLLYVKSTYPTPVFESALLSLWPAMWAKHIDLSKPELFAQVLAPLFSEEEVRKIIAAAGEKEFKDMLTATTERAVAEGAFGAPWCSVTNREGVKEGFFGSDRFHYMFEFLGLPVQHMYIKPKEKANL